TSQCTAEVSWGGEGLCVRPCCHPNGAGEYGQNGKRGDVCRSCIRSDGECVRTCGTQPGSVFSYGGWELKSRAGENSVRSTSSWSLSADVPAESVGRSEL
ncbi:unnamed protein product, partial [Discosporangium mesarthrocarpum]